jgi:hypothetical protein
VIPLGQNLSTYLYQITLFLTFKTDEMPFPFLPFPDGTPGSKLDADNEESVATSEASTQEDEEFVDAAGEDIDTRNDSFKG